MSISLELLNQDTYEMILPWRNAPAVRERMCTRHEITPAGHQAGFERMQADSSKQWYLSRQGVRKAVRVAYFTGI